jgi:hypothetical protein
MNKEYPTTVTEILKNPLTWLLIFLVVILVFSIPLFVINLSVGGWSDYSSSGQIGDTIGGITAPIVNLISAFLVFLALKAQIDANNVIQKQIDESREERDVETHSKELNTLFSYLEKQVSSIEYVGIDGNTYNGTKGISRILERTIHLNHLKSVTLPLPEYASVFSSLRLFEMILEKIKTSKAPIKERELYNELVAHLYYTYYFSAQHVVLEKEKSRGACSSCNAKHELPGEHINLTEKIEGLITGNRNFKSENEIN